MSLADLYVLDSRCFGPIDTHSNNIIGVIDNCKHPKAAKLFVDYMLSKETRTVELEKFFRRPARTDIDVAGLVKGLPSIAGIKLVDMDFNAATQERQDPDEVRKLDLHHPRRAEA